MISSVPHDCQAFFRCPEHFRPLRAASSHGVALVRLLERPFQPVGQGGADALVESAPMFVCALPYAHAIQPDFWLGPLPAPRSETSALPQTAAHSLSKPPGELSRPLGRATPLVPFAGALWPVFRFHEQAERLPGVRQTMRGLETPRQWLRRACLQEREGEA